MQRIKENKKTIIPLILIIIVLIGATYAWLSATTESENQNKILSGTLELEIISENNTINLENAYPLSDSEGLELQEYEFKIKNKGTINSDYTIYLDDIELEENEERMEDKYLNYTLNSNMEIYKLTEIGENPNRVLETGTIRSGETNTYKLRIWIDKDADNEAMNKIFLGKIRIESAQAKKVISNSNIKAVYVYDEENTATKCITGEETTCQPTGCYKSKKRNSCPIGTIVKYAVNNNNAIAYFYVLHDDGETLTLQHRYNTVRNVSWYVDSNDNTKGPLTILPQLESVTSSWTNVNDQTYTMGTTNFNKTNSFTGCPYSDSININCTTNKYTLPERTAKARMITVQEVMATGCKAWQPDFSTKGSCPDFMFNYLYQSTASGGNVDDNSIVNNNYNSGYWTMSADTTASRPDTRSWLINRMGYVGGENTTDPYFSARAVVVINK